MAMRGRGAISLAGSMAGLLALSACGPSKQAPIENIPAPLPQNLPIVEPPPPPPPVMINQSKAEDLWHLRSGLNVAVLLCQGPDNAALVASYNRLLIGQKALLSAAAQAEVDLFKARGSKTWQDAYDDHMTRVYNAYSGTLTRDAFCSRSKAVLGEAELTATDLLIDRAPVMLWELNKAAGLPDPDGKLARAAAAAAPVPAPPLPEISTKPSSETKKAAVGRRAAATMTKTAKRK